MKYETKEEILKALGNFKAVENMTSNNGNDIPNQFIIYHENGRIFQSYNSIIVVSLDSEIREEGVKYYLGDDWEYSKTTGKYRNLFLRKDKKEILQDIKDGAAVEIRGL